MDGTFLMGDVRENWLLGKNLIKRVGLCKVIKPAILFCACNEAIKCIL